MERPPAYTPHQLGLSRTTLPIDRHVARNFFCQPAHRGALANSGIFSTTDNTDMRVLLIQLDGKLPNIALMRIAAHYASDDVTLRHGGERHLWDEPWDRVYASAIFEKTAPGIARVLREHPHTIFGGTGYDRKVTLENYGITTLRQDYSIYPDFPHSIGFTQRGCRLRCPFCVVPIKEGAVREEQNIWEIWRGDPWPRELLLLDNDFFGQPSWRKRVQELRDGHFRVSFNQGINARFLTDEAAEAIASVDYRDDSMQNKRIYTAWDNRKDENRLLAGLARLVKYGVKPDHIMVYMLCGYWPGETHEDRDYRRQRLREFGARPYPMPYVRTPELIGYQRWVIGAYDKRIPWKEWSGARYRPENLQPPPIFPLFEHQEEDLQ
jgi:hypothetical protein